MIDVIDGSDALAEIEEITYRRENIIEYDMLRDKFIGPDSDFLLNFRIIGRIIKNVPEDFE